MANSTCIKCGNNAFEMVERTPIGSNYKFWFIQCAKCGGVVGVTDYLNTGQGIHDIKVKMGILPL